jgi:hypothetical protein
MLASTVILWLMPRLWGAVPRFSLSRSRTLTKPSVSAIGGVIAVVALGAILYFGAQTPPTVSTLAPVSKPQVLKPPVVPPLVKKPTHSRRVPKGGKIKCELVPQIAHQFSKDQVLAAAKEYGLSPAQISALRVCLR